MARTDTAREDSHGLTEKVYASPHSAPSRYAPRIPRRAEPCARAVIRRLPVGLIEVEVKRAWIAPARQRSRGARAQPSPHLTPRRWCGLIIINPPLSMRRRRRRRQEQLVFRRGGQTDAGACPLHKAHRAAGAARVTRRLREGSTRLTAANPPCDASLSSAPQWS
eukprot:scaffold650_cov407-Prasinococcus_capsulatus_cf.AAC.22